MTSAHRAWLATLLLVALLLPTGAAGAESSADASSKLERKAAKALARFRENPRTLAYFEQARGYVILPNVVRGGAGFGFAYGAGLVVEQGATIGEARFYQFTSGIQAGVRVFSMIVFFKDEEALEYFKRERLEFVGQAGGALGPLGAIADPAYNSGVAIFGRTKGGLMFEATISGARFTYKPLDPR